MTVTSAGSGPKRERQYEHIRESAEERGVTEEIAARTVDKERARAGESKTARRSSPHDISSGRRGGLRSGHGAQSPTYDQLYAEARRRGADGRSHTGKAELERALGES